MRRGRGAAGDSGEGKRRAGGGGNSLRFNKLSGTLSAMRKPLSGSVYVAERDGLHKVGFSRGHVRRRVRNCGGSLVLEIPCNLPVSALENLKRVRRAGIQA